MRLLRTIRDTDVEADFPAPAPYRERRAARAVVFDTDRNVALLHATNKSYHKLPGGGIEEGEDILTALQRELQEEIGCSAQNIRELGMIEEYRNQFGLHQLSYCYLADLAGAKGTPHLEEDEAADGFETVWLDLDKAIETLQNETDIENYDGKFIRARDLAFLLEAQKAADARPQ